MPYDPTHDRREPWQLSREEYLEYLKTLEPLDWFYEVTDWGAIEQLLIDVLARRITFVYELMKHEPPHTHTIVFEGVRAAFYESGHDEALVRTDIVKDWEGGNYRQTGLYLITMEPFAAPHEIPPGANETATTPPPFSGVRRQVVTNFVLGFNVFNESLNIAASRIIIDGRVFEVGYPTPSPEP